MENYTAVALASTIVLVALLIVFLATYKKLKDLEKKI